MTSPDSEESERKRRADLTAAEEEAWRAEDEYRQQKAEEEEAENRQSAIDAMIGWFGEQFEDPQNETPYDNEDGQYVYVFGGPFEASEVLWDQFGSEYEQEWIEAAVEQIQADGTYEWAPSSNGDYYEHPEDEDGDAIPASPTQPELRSQILGRLDALEAQLSSLAGEPAPIGHNQPPDDVGLPPYDDDNRRELQAAIASTRNEVTSDEPDQTQLEKSESTFKRIGAAIVGWVGRKLDLAVDEAIKAGMKLVIWAEVGKELLALAADLAKFLQHL